MINHEEIIKRIELIPHPEGGYYREVYRSEENIISNQLPDRYNSKRSFSTSIYYMLVKEQISVFHKLKSDEIWHFYHSSPLHIHLLDAKSGYKKLKLGNNLIAVEIPQFVIPKGTFFAAEVVDKKSFTLIGCTVSPGFEFADFEFGIADQLLKQFPQQKELIIRLSKKDE
ncbi:MAG: cupin domain-containing protein [Melioribacter sp.]|nr:cupin domain-containing protein [Melioribacter sp.]